MNLDFAILSQLKKVCVYLTYFMDQRYAKQETHVRLEKGGGEGFGNTHEISEGGQGMERAIF